MNIFRELLAKLHIAREWVFCGDEDFMSCAGGWRSWFAAIQIHLLIFPIIAVCTASIAFLCGGKCAIWQWWFSFLISSVYIFMRFSKRQACVSVLCLISFLLFLWFAATIIIDDAGGDNACYHLPAIRMLCTGWNPVFVATPEAIQREVGLDPGKMRVYHVLFTEKVVWVFNALFSLFSRDSFAFLFPLPFFLLCSVAFTVFRVFPEWHRLSKCLVIWVIWVASPCSISGPTDSVCALAGAGLVLAMLGDISGKGRFWGDLFGYSFWMMNSKAPGLLTCFVFWCIYAAWLFFCHKQSFRSNFTFLFLYGILLTSLFAVVSFSPYLTAWRDFGHPLYPFKTIDAQRYPIRDITYDFDYTDSKYECIGRLGNFINAYVNPAVVRKYYSIRMHDSDFIPVRRIWKMDWEQGGIPEKTSPTTPKFRMQICLVVILLFLVPRFKLVGAMVLLGLFFFPCKYMGYMRYLPWYCIGEACLSGGAMEYCLSHRFRPLSWLFTLLFMYQIAFHIVRYTMLLSISINDKIVFSYCEPTCIYGSTWDVAFIEKGNYGTMPPPDDSDAWRQRALLFETKGDPSMTTLNNLFLLKNDCKNLRFADVAPIPVDKVSNYSKTPFGFYIDGGNSMLADPKYAPGMDDLRKNLTQVPLFVAKAWFISLPKLMWKRFADGF